MGRASHVAREVIPERTAMWLGHYSTAFLLAAVTVSVADDATGQSNGGVQWRATVAWTAWILAWAAGDHRHREHLCERCIAASPLDPQAEIDRWRRVLRLHHARRAMIALFGGIIAWDFASDALFRHPPIWVLALDAVTVVVLGASYVVTWKHRQLYPWCPFCRWGDGGEHEVSPDVPAPAASL